VDDATAYLKTMILEFLILRRPLSLQAKARRLRDWKDYVRLQAENSWTNPMIEVGNLQFTLVYLCGEAPPDTDNIVKPILDALIGLVYKDDSLIADVDSHRRSITDPFDLTRLPLLLLEGLSSGKECVYVQVRNSQPLEQYL
jgi:crossover junction endodeoxyribonuclease RusA